MKFAQPSSRAIIISLLIGLALKLVIVDAFGLQALAPFIKTCADTVREIYMRLLRFLSLPILFFAILATMAQFQSIQEIRDRLGHVLKWTLLTTFMAALLAAICFQILYPVVQPQNIVHKLAASFDALKAIVPDNIVTMFSEQNVIAVVLFGLILGSVTLFLPEDRKKGVAEAYLSLNSIFMTLARGLIICLPIVLWSFSYQWADQLDEHYAATMQLGMYALTILLANTIQAVVVLPLILLMKRLNPRTLFNAMLPALNLAFFSKSSSATLPLSIECATNRAKLPASTVRYTMPLCSTVNMNGCAGFIYITVMFVAETHGVSFSVFEKVMWVFLSVVAAFGNAGVPMGCYFMAQAFLVMMDVPTGMMALILPFYAFLDMYETAINIWSDSCVTAICAQKDMELAHG